VVEEAARELGWEVETSRRSQAWDVLWVDSHIEVHDLYRLHAHQRISHFPAIYVLTRKNFLGRSLMRMRALFPDQYSFFPSTWALPSDYAELLRFDEAAKEGTKKEEEVKDKSTKDESTNNNHTKDNNTKDKNTKNEGRFYIFKPEAQSQGKGIKLHSRAAQLKGKCGIVQQYVDDPFLIEQLKFDLRIYVLLMGYDPLRVFISDEGLGRFATERYQSVRRRNMKDVRMHLTNYAVNKGSPNFVFNRSEAEMGRGHKRSLSAIYSLLGARGVDVARLRRLID
jgi:tubulin polyglutamylase TTLL6/13